MHLSFIFLAPVAQLEEQIPSKNEVGSSILSRGADFYFFCPGGGTGRRRGLKNPRRKLCQFDPGLGH